MPFTVTLVYPHTFWYGWRNRVTLWRSKPLYSLRARDPLVTVVVTKAAGQADPATTSPINFTVTFSRPVIGLNNDALIPSFTTTPGRITTTTTGGPAVYNIAYFGMTGPGNAGLTVDGRRCTDVNGIAAGMSNTLLIAYAPP